MNRDFKGIWIPREIWLNRDLSLQAKCLWAEIDSLYDRDRGGCFASDEYLMEFMDMKKTRFYELCQELKEFGLLEVVSFDGRNVVRKALKPIEETQENEKTAESCYPEKRIAPIRKSGVPPYIDTKLDNSNNTPYIPKSNPVISRDSANAECVSVKSTFPKKDEKKGYGDEGTVKLTEQQYIDLLKVMTPKERDSWIQDVSLEIAKKGEAYFNKKYKSHYHTIISWKRFREQKFGNNTPGLDNSQIAKHRVGKKTVTLGDQKQENYEMENL